MSGSDPTHEAILTRIRAQLAADAVLLTQHGQQEMVEEEIGLDEVYQALETGAVLENYPDHRREACGLYQWEARVDCHHRLRAQATEMDDTH